MMYAGGPGAAPQAACCTDHLPLREAGGGEGGGGEERADVILGGVVAGGPLGMLMRNVYGGLHSLPCDVLLE